VIIEKPALFEGLIPYLFLESTVTRNLKSQTVSTVAKLLPDRLALERIRKNIGDIGASEGIRTFAGKVRVS